MTNNDSKRNRRLVADFTLYLHNGFILVRPDTARAREHLQRNESDYREWLNRFYFGDGSSILMERQPEGGIYLKPKSDWRALGDLLVQRGFIVARNQEDNPPFLRLVLQKARRRWLLQCNNCRVPQAISRLIIRGAGSPN